MKKILLAFFIFLVPLSVSAQGGNYCSNDSSAISSTELCNPTARFAGDFNQFLTNVLIVFGAAVGGQAIVYVVFAGFRMIISQGDSEAIATAKRSLQWAVLGLLLIIGSFALVYATSKFLGTTDVNLHFDEPIRNEVTQPTRAGTFGEFVVTMLRGLLGIAGLLALMMIIINGFRYITAGGKEEQVESAKEGLQWAVVGLVVIAFAYTIIQATWKLFNS